MRDAASGANVDRGTARSALTFVSTQTFLRMKSKHRLAFLFSCLATLWVSTITALAQADHGWQPDVNRPVSSEEVQQAETLGWHEAAAALSKTFSSRSAEWINSPHIQSWWQLFRWCQWLSTPEPDAATDWARHRIIEAQDLAPEGAPPKELPGRDVFLQTFQNPNAAQSLLERLGAGPFTLRTGTLAERAEPAQIREWINDPALSHSLWELLAPEDFAPAVMDILTRLHKNRSAWAGHQALAVALALVHDVPPPPSWPHHQVPPKALSAPRATPEELFAWFSQNSRLLLDPSRLQANQLLFVVDAFVPLSELEWAGANVKLPRSRFDDAFGMVRYDHGRLRRMNLVWPHNDYRLSTLLETGGICVDQAYFAALCGKARGLPTLYFSGQGGDGGHAWFGFMKSDDRWELECGRYANQGYVTGFARHPQTWLPISDHELRFLASPFRDSSEFARSQTLKELAAHFAQAQEPDKALETIEASLRASPMNVAAWNFKTTLLTTPTNRTSELRAHLNAAIHQFTSQDDLRTGFELQLADLDRSEGRTESALQTERRIVSRNRQDRSDLSVDVSAKNLMDLVAADDRDGAARLYRQTLQRLGKSGGGNLFYAIVQPYVSSLIEKGNRQEACQAIDAARRALAPESGSILDRDLLSLEQESGAARKK
jgi:hypothetical protein